MAGAGERGAQQVIENFKSVEGEGSKMFGDPIDPPCPTGEERSPSWMHELDENINEGDV